MLHSTEIHTLVLDCDAHDENLVRTVERLIAWSRQTALLRPGRVVALEAVEQIRTSVKGWASGFSRPWIIAGRLKASKSAVEYGGPFISDCQDTGYGEQVSRLQDVFDWAVFSYFTTYQDDIRIFVTRSSELHARLLAEQPRPLVLGDYHGQPPTLPLFRNATFYDDAAQGWLAYELALARGEEPPLVLCSIGSTNPDLYRTWDEETDTLGDRAWYEQPLSKLDRVGELCFRFRTAYGAQELFTLHRAVDASAYLALWKMSGSDSAIARATLAADCDWTRLRELLCIDGSFDVIRQTEKVASWAYGHVHGGGADEYHAVFHGRDAAITQQVWEHVGARGISRF